LNLEPGQLPERSLPTFPISFESAREPDAEHLRAGVAAARSVAVLDRHTAKAVRDADNNKGLPIFVAAIGKGGKGGKGGSSS
jgi:hypothetical protein